MATIDATVGGASANSYLTNAEATVFLETHALYNTWWSEDTLQGNKLIEATRLLDEYVDWKGTINGATQALRWPRTGALNRDEQVIAADTIPEGVKRATAVFAAELLAEDRQAERDDTGIRSVSVAGAVSVNFDKTDKKKVIPESVRSIIREFGTVIGWGSQAKVVRG